MTTIFEPGATLAVDYREYEVDLEQRAYDRLLYQFKNSTALRSYLFSRIATVELLRAAAVQTISYRTLENARGDVLDIIGRIVGQERIELNAAVRQWFGPDIEDSSIGPADRAPAYVAGAPLFGTLPADDVQYLQLILAKIFKNHVYGSSLPELSRFISFFSNTPVSVVTSGPMEVTVLIPSDFPLNVLLTLLSVYDDKTADRRYLIPVAATVELRGIIYRPATPFAPDRVGNEADVGAAAVGLTLEAIEELT